jgi:hypothetical protein
MTLNKASLGKEFSNLLSMPVGKYSDEWSKSSNVYLLQYFKMYGPLTVRPQLDILLSCIGAFDGTLEFYFSLRIFSGNQ